VPAFEVQHSRFIRTSFLSFLFLLIAVLPSNGAPHKQLPREMLEKIADPPMFIFRNDVSPATTSQHGAFTSYQVNVSASGQNIINDAANEPSIAVDPTNHSKMSIGWRQFDSTSSNFRKAGWGFTNSSGRWWTFPGTLENFIFRSDPVLDSDSTGGFFYLSLLETFFDDIWRSLNGGQSFVRLAPATGGDKQWFTIDKSNSSGRGFQYQCWSTAGNNYGGRQFSRSVDGGASWLDPLNIPNSPSWGTLDVDSNGNLFIGGVNLETGEIWCVRSSNAKDAGAIPTFDQVTLIDLGGDITSGDIINPLGITGQVYIAADRSGTSTNNNVYMLASVQRTGFATGADVMFVSSTDVGQTFSAPRRINNDPINPNKWHWFATMAVAPNGRIDVVWLDTRNAQNNINSQLFYSYGTDGGNTWSPNVEVSDVFDPRLGYPNQNKMGDYMALVSDSGGGDVAYCATFNGEQDVYYVRVSPPASHLLNISSRLSVLAGENVLIGGFIINGTDPKRVMIRGIGPTLNVTGMKLADPTLELHQGSATLVTNDNWKVRSDGTSQQAEIEATGIAPTNDLESAMVVTLNPGSYTAILAGKDGTTGVGVVELFDLAQGANSRLANISARGFVRTDNDVLIGGFIVGSGGGGDSKIAVRAIGPSLGAAGVQGALQDPTLELHNANGILTASNDNWKTNDQSLQSQEADVRAIMLPPENDLESVIVAALPPGPHTAVVRGKNNTIGVALVEVFNLP